MATHTYSPAQILVAAGLHVPSPPEQTPAQWEVVVEHLYGTNARMVFTHGHVPDAMDPTSTTSWSPWIARTYTWTKLPWTK